jgi:DNA mismatch repair ATPase MutS
MVLTVFLGSLHLLTQVRSVPYRCIAHGKTESPFLCMQTKPKTPTAFATTFAYKVVKGPCQDAHYGLELAKLAALPEDVMMHAERVAKQLSGAEARGGWMTRQQTADI